MRRSLLHAAVATAALLWSSRGPTAASRPIGVDDLMKLRSISEVRIAADGDRIAYVVSTPSLPKNEHEGTLFVVPASGGIPAQLGESIRIFNVPTPRPQLRWSPDGSTISVLAFDGQRPQVFGVPVSGTAPRALTRAPDGVFAYEWAPDGQSLAYITRDPMPAEEERQRQDRSFVIRAEAPERSTRVMVQRLDGSTPLALTPPAHYVDALSWSPDGREIAYSAAPRTGFTAAYDARIFAIALDGSTQRTIVDRAGMNTGPRYSPDGRQIAFISTNGRSDIMAARSLAVVAAAGGTPRTFALDDAWVNEYVWGPDSPLDLLPGQRRHLRPGAAHVRATGGSADGRGRTGRAAHTGTRRRLLDQPRRRRTARGVQAGRGKDDGRRRRHGRRQRPRHDCHRRQSRAARFRAGRAEADQMAVLRRHGNLGAAVDAGRIPAGRRLPTLVYVHGGPGGGFTYGLFPQFMHLVAQVDPYPTAAMAGLGYAVLFPMPRGGAGYGEAGQRAIVNSWGVGDYKDIISGVEHLIAQGIADPDRLGVMGASYGGYMTNWIVTQTGRFKAASAGASLSDLSDIFYLSEGGEFMTGYFKRPWENRESYAAHSPLTFADRVTTPLLIQHGEVDPRVPIAGAWKLYRTLKQMGKTVELETYPRGGHVLREPMPEREQMRRNLEWFTKWIRTGS